MGAGSRSPRGYDGLQAACAKVRGAAIIAADANDDGVTRAELAAVQLTSLPLSQYDTTGAASVKTLADRVSGIPSRNLGPLVLFKRA